MHRSTQGLLTIWHGLSMARWGALKATNPPWSPSTRFRWWSISAFAVLNSFYEWWEELLFQRKLQQLQITHPPIFVLGHWRSGTTLLHELLTLNPQFTYPNMYQVLFPGHFLLTEKVNTALTGWLVPRTRPMDKMSAHWKMPQEDEMQLLNRTFISPYLMLCFQGEREKYGRFFDLEDLTPAERELWIREFLLFAKKLTLRENKPIVFKSPSHTYRVPLLLELFPEAKFVYIYREPYAVCKSCIHLRQTMFTENALGNVNFNGLEEDMLLTYTNCIQRYEATKSQIPAGNLCELRFEDLEADPVSEMRRVYQALSLPGWDTVEPALQARMPGHKSYKKNRFPTDASSLRRWHAACRQIFETYGYDPQVPEGAAAPR